MPFTNPDTKTLYSAAIKQCRDVLCDMILGNPETKITWNHASSQKHEEGHDLLKNKQGVYIHVRLKYKIYFYIKTINCVTYRMSCKKSVPTVEMFK